MRPVSHVPVCWPVMVVTHLPEEQSGETPLSGSQASPVPPEVQVPSAPTMLPAQCPLAQSVSAAQGWPIAPDLQCELTQYPDAQSVPPLQGASRLPVVHLREESPIAYEQ